MGERGCTLWLSQWIRDQGSFESHANQLPAQGLSLHGRVFLREVCVSARTGGGSNDDSIYIRSSQTLIRASEAAKYRIRIKAG